MDANENQSVVQEGRRFPLRFSLWTLFVLAILLSLVISNLITSWHLRKSQETIAMKNAEIDSHLAEIEQYKDQLGILRVGDETKTHLIAVEMHQDLVWCWRLFVPEGEKYDIRSVVGDIPENDYPVAHQYTTLSSGETRLTVSIFRDAAGEWKEKIEMAQGRDKSSMTIHLDEEKMAWYGKPGSTRTSEFSPNYGQKTEVPSERIELIRIRKWPRFEPGVTPDQSKPTDGFVLWLEPVNKLESVNRPDARAN